jgi:peroxiredoxin
VELPRLQTIYQEIDNPDFQIIAAEVNDDREGADQFIAENGLTFTFADADRVFVKRYFNTAGYPNSFIIGRDGVIVEHHRGFRAGDETAIKEKLQALLRQ